MLNDALKFIRLGFAICPLLPKYKKPYCQHNTKTPITDEDTAKRHWLQHKNDGVGIVLGQHSGLVAIDIDCNHGATLDMIKDFPRTVTVRTRNGYHLYFKWEPNLEDKTIVPPAEGKAWNQAPACLYVGGRQFVAPPTVVEYDNDGNLQVPWEYRYHSDQAGDLSFEDCKLAPLPEAWRPPQNPSGDTKVQPGGSVSPDVVRQSEPPEEHSERPSPIYLPNTRHEMFLRTAVAMRAKGHESHAIYQAILDRNQKHAKPPKEQAEEEIKKIVTWAMASVKIAPPKEKVFNSKEQDYVLPLGFFKDEFFYTSSRNRQIVSLASNSHTTRQLLSLQPLGFWKHNYPKYDKSGNLSADWDQVASDLMEAALDEGIFDDTRIRGAGCWSDKGKLVVHTGTQLYYDSVHHDINDIESDHIYTLTKDYSVPSMPALTVEECQALVAACSAPEWEDKSSGMLLAGAMAILRLSGALPWRPHVWISGATGQGKSTVYRRIIEPIAGKVSLKPTGRTTEPGLRQKLQNSTRPVIYDEAETNDKTSAARMKAVVEFFRLSSFETDATVMKGTGDGSGIEFRACSMGILVSIRVNLTDQADINRFAVLDLSPHDSSKKDEFERKLDPITREFGDRLFARAIKSYPKILADMKTLEDAVATKTNRRDGQQYGTLLAGYASLLSDSPLTKVEAMALVELLPRFKHKAVAQDVERDEVECLERVLQTTISVTDGSTTTQKPIGELLDLARLNPRSNYTLTLRSHGIDIEHDTVYICNSHVTLERVFNDTRWSKNWNRTLKRLHGAQPSVLRRIGQRPCRCVSIPVKSIFDL